MTRWAAVILSLGLSVIVAVSIQPEIAGLFHDDGIYAVVGKSISAGTGYRITSLPSSPPQTKYPFLYSTLLAIGWKFGGSWPAVVVWLKAINVACYFAVLLGAWRLFESRTERAGIGALGFVLLVGTNVAVVSYVDLALTETLFLALTVWAVALHVEGTPGPRVPPGPWRSALVVALACLTREAGLALAVAGAVHAAFFRPRRDFLIYVGIVAATVSSWIAWKVVMTAPVGVLETYYTSYETPAFVTAFGQPARAAQIVWGNVIYVVESLDRDLLLPLLPVMRVAVYPLLLVGVLSGIRRTSVFLSVFVTVYLAGILSHPFHPHRYVLPLIPAILLLLFQGAATVTRALGLWFGRAPRTDTAIRAVLAAPLVLLMVFNLLWLTRYVQQPPDGLVRGWYGGRFSYSWAGFTETFDWIRTHTREEDVVASAYDPLYFLSTGRRGVRPWLHQPETYFYPRGRAVADLGDPTAVRRELDALGVRFLVIDPLDGYAEAQAGPEYFRSLLAAYPVTPALVFTSRDGKHRVYALPPDRDAK